MKPPPSVERVRMLCEMERIAAELEEQRVRIRRVASELRSATATAGIPHHHAAELADRLTS